MSSVKKVDPKPFSEFSLPIISSVIAVLASLFISSVLFPELNFLKQYFNFAIYQIQDNCNADQYLSESAVIGFHPICVLRTSEDTLQVEAYVDGRNESIRFNVPSNYQSLRSSLESMLKLEELYDGASPPHKYPWEMFSPDGNLKISSLKDVASKVVGECKLSFVFKGGSFIWPGVKVGHKQIVENLQGIGKIEMTTLSMQPLIFTMNNFLSDSECEYVITQSSKYLKPSPVTLMDSDIGKEATQWRTSSTYFMDSSDHESLQKIDRRVSDITRQPVSHQELVQVLRYEVGQFYNSHHDFFDPVLYTKDESILELTDGGRKNRMITVFWYLSNVTAGGETAFTNANGDREELNAHSCANSLSIKPLRGRVAMFYSLRPDGQFDYFSLHGACPVLKGTKLAANKWVWNRPL